MDDEDGYFGASVAATYDESSADMFDPAVVEPAVDLLAELAGPGRALELAVGTGRIALPLARRGVAVHGIDLSRAMVARLQPNYVSVTGGRGSTARFRSGTCGRPSWTSWPSSPACGCVTASTGGRGNRLPAIAASTSRSGRSPQASVPQAETRSQTKMSVSPGAITLPAPRVP